MKHKTITKHGPGAAHIRHWMFGARGPLLNLEGGGNGAPAPTATPGVAPPAPQGDPATAPGAAPAEKLLPQSQVNALIAEAKRDSEAKTRAKVVQEQKDAEAARAVEVKASAAAAAKPSGSASGLSADEVQLMIARARAFERVTATAGLNERQVARMEEALATSKPTDIAEWSRTYLEDMGIGSRQITTTTTAPGTAAPPVVVTPATSAAATTTVPATNATPPAAAPNAPTVPVSPTTSNGLVDLFRLTSEQLDQLGPSGVREHFDKALAIGRQQGGALPRPKLPPR